jgi:hypothetical protein
VLNHLQKKAGQRMEARIELSDYDESQLVEVRVSLNLPYQNTWTDFERCYGEIEIDGRYYTYVKRKIEENVLILQCIPNIQKQEIKNTDNFLTNAIQGAEQGQQKERQLPVNSFGKNILSDYDDACINYTIEMPGESGNHWLTRDNSSLYENFIPVYKQPPGA